MTNEFSGVVTRGDKRGRRLGFPSANIALKASYPVGIYAGEAWVQKQHYLAVIYIGPGQKTLEAHLIDFSGDIYGKEMRVVIVRKIRSFEKIFKNEGELIQAMRDDVQKVKQGKSVK